MAVRGWVSRGSARVQAPYRRPHVLSCGLDTRSTPRRRGAENTQTNAGRKETQKMGRTDRVHRASGLLGSCQCLALVYACGRRYVAAPSRSAAASARGFRFTRGRLGETCPYADGERWGWQPSIVGGLDVYCDVWWLNQEERRKVLGDLGRDGERRRDGARGALDTAHPHTC